MMMGYNGFGLLWVVAVVFFLIALIVGTMYLLEWNKLPRKLYRYLSGRK